MFLGRTSWSKIKVALTGTLVLVGLIGSQMFLALNTPQKELRENIRFAVQLELLLLFGWVMFWSCFGYLYKRLITDTNVQSGLIKSTAIVYASSAQLAFPLARFAASVEPHWYNRFAWICMGSIMSLFAFVALSDLAMWIYRQFFPSQLKSKKKAAPPSYDRRVASAIVALTFLLTVASVYEAHKDPVLVRVNVVLPRLPKSMDGFRIIQVTDVHLGPTVGKSFMVELVDRINLLEPDLVAITGDLVDGSVPLFGECIQPLKDLKSKYGAFFVTGNHEYIHGHADEWVTELQKIGVRALRNERVTIGTESEGFELAGVEDWSAGNLGEHFPDIKQALAGRDKTKELILLAHQPKQIFQAVEEGVSLQISGHTHGGQFVPFHLPVFFANPYFAGLSKHPSSQTTIYVSRGTRFWGPPMRLFSPSEITEITLRSG